MTNRRDFVSTSIAAGAVLNGLVALPALAHTSGKPVQGVFPAKSVFESLKGQTLEVHAAGRPHGALQLVAVHDQSCCNRVEQFTLVLRGDDAQPLAGDMYRLAHARSGRFLLRLDPSGSDAHGPLYRAEVASLV